MKLVSLIPSIAVLSIHFCSESIAGDLQQYQAVRRLIGDGKYAEAVLASKELVRANPDRPQSYEALVDASNYGRTLDDATSFFYMLARYGTREDMAYYGAGLVQYSDHNFGSAAVLFERSISLGCTLPDCYKMLEYSYEKAVGEDATARYFSILCHKYPENPNHWYGLALASWEQKDGNMIMGCLKEALRRMPREPRYTQALAAAQSLYGEERLAQSAIDDLLASSIPEEDYQGYFFLQAHKYQLLEKVGMTIVDDLRLVDLAQLASRTGFHRWEGWCYLKQADLEFEKGDFSTAILFAKKAGSASDIALDADLKIATLGRMFESHLEIGQIGEAIEDGLARLKCINPGGTNRQLVKTFLDLGRAFHELCEDDLALDYLSEALSRAASLEKDTIIQIQLRASLGVVYEGLGKSSEALSIFKTALSFLQSKRVWTQTRAQVCGEIGKCFLKAGNYRAANLYFSTQGDLVYGFNLFRMEPDYLANLGDSYLARRKTIEAIRCFEKALGRARLMKLQEIANRSLVGIAHAKMMHRDKDGALRAYSELLSFLEIQTLPKIEYATLFKSGKMLRLEVEEYIHLLIEMGDVKRAFKLSELLRLRGLVDPFAVPLCRLQGTFGNTLRKQADSLRSHLGGLYSRDLNSQNKSIFEGGLLRKLEYQSQIAELVLGFERTLLKLATLSSANRDIIAPYPIGMEQLQHILSETGSAILDYLVGELGTIVFVVTPDTVCAFEAKLGADSLNGLVQRLTNLLCTEKDMDAMWTPILANYDSIASLKLCDLLVQSAMPQIRNIGRLIIIGDECLRNLPFEILKLDPFYSTASRHSGFSQFLVERFEISYLILATSLRGGREKLQVGNILAVGSDYGRRQVGEDEVSSANGVSSPDIQPRHYSLPGVRDEVQRIKMLCGADLVIAPADGVGKVEFLNYVPTSEIVHIASHVKWNRECPITSSIGISDIDSQSSEGELHAYELSGLDLRSHMLVLSACNSARWSPEAKRYGFLSAAIGSDAGLIVGAVWPIEDESTARLMEAFYGNLRLGMRAGRALQLAKIRMINSGERDPFFWGGFILIGPNIPIEFRESSTSAKSMWTIGLSVGTLCFFIFAINSFRHIQASKNVEESDLH